MFSFALSASAVESIEWTDALREEYIQKYDDGELTLADMISLMDQDDKLGSMFISWLANNSEGGFDIRPSDEYVASFSDDECVRSDSIWSVFLCNRLLICCALAVFVLISLFLHVIFKSTMSKYVFFCIF